MEVTLGLLWLLTLWGVAGAGVAPLRAPAVRFAKVSDKIRFSCDGVPRPLRWVWVPQFPNCPWAGSGGGPGAGGVPGRRPVLWPPPATSRPPFLHRLRALDPGIRELELTVARGDSGTFYCVGEQRDTESCVRVHVREDLAACLPPEAPAPKAQPGCPRLYAPLGAGLLLALAGLGLAWKLRR
ncbi:megakaryocyte and platelet inhibitory receptor G6b [Ornithorhynchus anatinus]|uniref:megakaryocyte and platelet inhibitory receptor G6b n=1 Tax=Ornithorhynchus anatinus TaxID=9258 RepID=UPI0010A8A70E|nr:megakaryocyte and platelet inhibitory receptor G6b [Ornithorhynchus anatinus]